MKRRWGKGWVKSACPGFPLVHEGEKEKEGGGRRGKRRKEGKKDERKEERKIEKGKHSDSIISEVNC
jgi:hypothetical protein